MEQKNREYRVAELRAASDSDYRIEGYASTFAPYEMCEIDGVKYFERIEPTAFDDADMTDVVLRVDHEGPVYARTSAGTIELDTDSHGLHIVGDLSRTANSRALYEEIKAGNYPQMSFAFTIEDKGDRFDEESRTRVISRIRKLYDVSAVFTPAYQATSISARSKDYIDKQIEVEKQIDELDKIISNL